MQFMTVSRRRIESFSESAFAAKREEKAERVRVPYVEGAIRQIWFRGDQPGCRLQLNRELNVRFAAKFQTIFGFSSSFEKRFRLKTFPTRRSAALSL
jgi:hypothetical protein